MKLNLIVLTILISHITLAQVPTKFGFTLSDKYSEEIVVAKAQMYLMNEVFDSSDDASQFKLDRVASSISGDLTSLFYKYKGKKGLLLAFYGECWNDAGDIYTGFIFKNFLEEEAVNFLNKIESALTNQRDFLAEDVNNNVAFRFGDLSVIVSRTIEFNIRIFWNGMDADWEKWAFERTKRVLNR